MTDREKNFMQAIDTIFRFNFYKLPVWPKLTFELTVIILMKIEISFIISIIEEYWEKVKKENHGLSHVNFSEIIGDRD